MWRVQSIAPGLHVLFANLVDQLHAVVRPDQLAEIIEQLDDGESLLWGPVGGDGEGNGEERWVEGKGVMTCLRGACVPAVRRVLGLL